MVTDSGSRARYEVGQGADFEQVELRCPRGIKRARQGNRTHVAGRPRGWSSSTFVR